MSYYDNDYSNENYDPDSLDMRNGGHCAIHGDETHWNGVEEDEEAGLAWCFSCQALVKFIPGEEDYDPGEMPYERSGPGRGFW